MFDIKTLKNCYAWGWINDDYLDRLVGLGQISTAEKDIITGKKIVSINK